MKTKCFVNSGSRNNLEKGKRGGKKSLGRAFSRDEEIIIYLLLYSCIIYQFGGKQRHENFAIESHQIF